MEEATAATTSCAAVQSGIYRRRRPERTVLHRLVRTHLETHLARTEETDPLGDGVPDFVEAQFRAYLRCGILAHGFARARCSGCGHAFLVAFSCQGRGICPSCNSRRMAATAAHLTDHVIPAVPVRQWVLSVPKRLRYFLHRDPKAAGAVLHILLRALRRTVRECSPGTGSDAKFGAVSYLHRFGASLNPHFHYHPCVLDGVFEAAGEGEGKGSPSGGVGFHEATALTGADVEALQETVRRRVLRWFGRQGLLEDHVVREMLAWDHAGGFTFRDSVLADPPEVMPLTAEVTPRFARMFPAAAQTFDNLHMMHDVINDIMADASLSRAEKEAEIERMRRNMIYAAQEVVTAPGMPMGEEHATSPGSMRVPTRLPDGSWLPQGHTGRAAGVDRGADDAPLPGPRTRDSDTRGARRASWRWAVTPRRGSGRDASPEGRSAAPRWRARRERHGVTPLLLAACLAIAKGALPRATTAQEDFRNVDLDRPLLTEDAYPVKLREWEWELGTRGRLLEGHNGSRAAGVAELKTGLFPNTQAGVELEGTVEDIGDGSGVGLKSFGAHLLYNVQREMWSGPALSGRVDVEGPGAGEVGREDWAVGLKGIVTRSLGRLRLHGNGGYRFASQGDGGDAWLAGLAFDHPIGLFSRVVMGDLFVEIPVDAGRTRVWLEAGTRWQLTTLSVLDVGLATRLDEWEAGRANLELVVGLSRVFGIPALTGVPAYPDPRID